MDAKAIYIGMDLGTFKTSVASSAGVRDVIHTAVGWPKDQVARTMLGRDVVFGKDLIEHRLAVNIIRPFEKGVLKYNNPDDAGVTPDQVTLYKQAASVAVGADRAKGFAVTETCLVCHGTGRMADIKEVHAK